MMRVSGRRVVGVAVMVSAVLVGSGMSGSSQAALAQDTQHKGMPQLDFGNPLLLSQVVWGAIIFAAFYVLCARWVLPMMGAVIATRQSSIANDLHAAHSAKLHADAAVRELLHARQSAQAGARAAVDAANQAAKTQAAAAAAESNARLDAQLDAAERQIAQARSQAMGALREIAVTTAGLVVQRLTSQAPDEAAVQTATDRVLRERALVA